MTNDNACRYCTERKVGCHSTCQKYLKWKAELDKANKKIRADKTNSFNACYVDYTKLHKRKFKI